MREKSVTVKMINEKGNKKYQLLFSRFREKWACSRNLKPQDEPDRRYIMTKAVFIWLPVGFKLATVHEDGVELARTSGEEEPKTKKTK